MVTIYLCLDNTGSVYAYININGENEFINNGLQYEYIDYCFSHDIYLYKVKLATLVKGDSKAPFSIATTPRCRGGHYSIPWIAPLYPWSIPYDAEC